MTTEEELAELRSDLDDLLQVAEGDGVEAAKSHSIRTLMASNRSLRERLAVFEQSHTPTNDEREAPGFAEREKRARQAWEFFARDDREMSHDFRGGYHQGMIDASRRPVQGEPKETPRFKVGDRVTSGTLAFTITGVSDYRPHPRMPSEYKFYYVGDEPYVRCGVWEQYLKPTAPGLGVRGEPTAFEKRHADHEHVGPYCMPQGEPTDDAPRDGAGDPLALNSRGEWVNEIGDTRCPNDGEFTNKRCWKCGWVRLALRAAAAVTEQEEPTDAQVLAALNAYGPESATDDLSNYHPINVAAMRAALRAAFTTEQGGEQR